jgi:SRSO17 transposase
MDGTTTCEADCATDGAAEIDEQFVAATGREMGRFLKDFGSCFTDRRAFDSFVAYCTGLGSQLPSKNVEAIALQAGKGVRAMQYFLSHGRWDHDRVRDRLQQRVAQKHCPAPGAARDGQTLCIGLIDETSMVKSGDKTPGVKRQYIGNRGKKENGIVTVHLGIKHGPFSTLLDSELFLPADWSADRQRCHDAGIPDSMTHRSKPMIALELHARVTANGVRLDYLVGDALYGRSNALHRELTKRGQTYVFEVPCDFRCYGCRPRYKSLQKPHQPHEVRHLARHGADFRGKSWQMMRIKLESRQAQQWEVRAGQVFLRTKDDKPSDQPAWLIAARRTPTEQPRYFISNAPPHTPVQTLVKVAFSRAEVEHQFRMVKQQVGLDDYEGRHYDGLMRHHLLCMLMMLFAAEQRAAQADFFP